MFIMALSTKHYPILTPYMPGKKGHVSDLSGCPVLACDLTDLRISVSDPIDLVLSERVITYYTGM